MSLSFEDINCGISLLLGDIQERDIAMIIWRYQEEDIVIVWRTLLITWLVSPRATKRKQKLINKQRIKKDRILQLDHINKPTKLLTYYLLYFEAVLSFFYPHISLEISPGGEVAPKSVCAADCYFKVNVLDLSFASPIAIYR